MATAPTNDALVVNNLSARYGRVISALRGASLRVGEGEVVTLMGANGAGKSTLARAVTGLLGHNRGSITEGTIHSFGTDVTTRSPRYIVRHGVGQTLEGRRIFTGLTVRENLEVGGATLRASASRRAASDVYDLFPRLAERRDQAAGLLSGGEQQMLALGRALIAAPRLLVLDEPTLGLSPKLVGSVRDAIRGIQAAGTSVLLIEQNAAMALSVADRGYVIVNGRIAHESDAASLRESAHLQRLLLGVAANEGAA